MRDSDLALGGDITNHLRCGSTLEGTVIGLVQRQDNDTAHTDLTQAEDTTDGLEHLRCVRRHVDKDHIGAGVIEVNRRRADSDTGEHNLHFVIWIVELPTHRLTILTFMGGAHAARLKPDQLQQRLGILKGHRPIEEEQQLPLLDNTGIIRILNKPLHLRRLPGHPISHRNAVP